MTQLVASPNRSLKVQWSNVTIRGVAVTTCCAVDSLFCFLLTIIDFSVKYVVAFGGRLLECFRQARSRELIGAIAENLSDSVSQ